MKRSIYYFCYFIAYNSCFFILQILLNYSENSSFASSITLPSRSILELVFTLLVHISFYLLLSLLQTFMLMGLLKRRWYYVSAEQWQVIIWALCAIVIISVNHYFFPLSLFSKLLPLPPLIDVIFLILSLSILSLFLANSLIQSPFIVLALAMALLGLVLKSEFSFLISTQEDLQQPNIIILGIDSLSPASITEQNMPFLNHILQQSTQFTNTISPLARTYPAWSSILTGLYAKNHRAQENLITKQEIASDRSIAWWLAAKGYNTVYATDDRRFNAIDHEFGFKTIIGPKLGINDILLGTFNDFPLSNLLINARFSSWLFPYNYSNRASFISYYPATFSALLQHELKAQPHNMPLFLAVHFTLPHWPYAWAQSSPQSLDNEFSLEHRNELYQQALVRVDQQFKTFYQYLAQNNYLNNSLVIILSDHGEVLFYPNSRLTNEANYQELPPSRLAAYLKNKTATVLNKSAGHGSDILSPQQYHSMLAVRIYKNGQLVSPIKKIATRIALIDLAPTILSFLKMNHKPIMDGISLLDAINSNQALPKRSFYLESGMFPNQSFSKAKTIAIGNLFYEVNPEGELVIKQDKLKEINDQKLYGIIEGDWILALYPDKQAYIAVIQNLRNGNWSDKLCSSFTRTTPFKTLSEKLQHFYGTQLAHPIPSCASEQQPMD